jgi:putative lipoprotein
MDSRGITRVGALLIGVAVLVAVVSGCSSETAQDVLKAISTVSSLVEQGTQGDGPAPFSAGETTTSSEGSGSTEPATTTTEPQGFGTVSGNVVYSERVALPADALVRISLVETPAIGPDAVLVEQVIATRGRQVPIPFELRYDVSTVDSTRTYGIVATVTVGGEIQFDSGSPTVVITQGNPSKVDVVVKQAK